MNYIKNIFNKYRYSSKVLKILNEYKNEQIEGITICRKPLPKTLDKIANFISSDDKFDNLFHLYLILSTSKGKVLIEKNEIVNITTNIIEYKGEEFFIISNFNNVTVFDFIENCRVYMGDKKFFSYDIVNNNCQYFVKCLLESNDIYDGISFIMQKISKIFLNHPKIKEILNGVVNLANISDRLTQMEISDIV